MDERTHTPENCKIHLLWQMVVVCWTGWMLWLCRGRSSCACYVACSTTSCRFLPQRSCGWSWRGRTWARSKKSFHHCACVSQTGGQLLGTTVFFTKLKTKYTEGFLLIDIRHSLHQRANDYLRVVMEEVNLGNAQNINFMLTNNYFPTSQNNYTSTKNSIYRRNFSFTNL